MWYLKQIHTLAFDSDGCNLTSDLITTLSRAALSTLPCQMEVTVLFELNNYQISGQWMTLATCVFQHKQHGQMYVPTSLFHINLNLDSSWHHDFKTSISLELGMAQDKISKVGYSAIFHEIQLQCSLCPCILGLMISLLSLRHRHRQPNPLAKLTAPQRLLQADWHPTSSKLQLGWPGSWT